MLFLDIEASGFDGYPVEIGVARVRPDGSVGSDSRLLSHGPWIEMAELWDPEAEKVHKISRQELVSQGRSLEEVRTWLEAEAQDRMVFIDSAYDARWLSWLYPRPIQAPRFSLAHVSIAFNGPGMDPVRRTRGWEAFQLGPVPHRAALDAERWARLYVDSLAQGAPVWSPAADEKV